MAFRTYTTAPASAVATNGTFTFALEDASVWGQIKNEGGHIMYAEGLQSLLQFNAGDFTWSASGATVTVTYKGTTSIPAGSTVRIQANTAGEPNYLFDGKGDIEPREAGKDYKGNPRWSTAKIVRVMLGQPATQSNTTVVNASARTGTNTLTTYATPVTLDVPRALQYLSSNAGDTTQTVTARGFDENGVAVTETATLNGSTGVNGKKAFKVVVSDTVSATLAGNLSIGTQAGALGLPFFAQGGTSLGIAYVVREVMDAAVPTAGTIAGGDLTIATATTGDVRGTYTPNSAPNGSRNYELFFAATDVSFKGVNQFGT